MSGQRLLLLSCSDAKRPSPGLLPATERYDGPPFRLLRKYFRDRPLEGQYLSVYVLSAKFGLIPGEQQIPFYDQRMTLTQARHLRNSVLRTLDVLFSYQQFDEFLISTGRIYLEALEGYESFLPASLSVSQAEGGQGHKLSKLHDWLYNEAPQAPACRKEGKIVLRGVEITITAEEAIALAKKILAEGQGGSTNYRSWYVLVGDVKVSPKWLVSYLTGLPVSSFVTGEARRVLAQMGIEVQRI